MKKQILSLIISTVGLSVTAESALPPFIENNQSKEELVTTKNELRFATKLHAEYAKNFSVEFKRTGKHEESSEKAYIQALETLGLLEERQKLETHFSVVLEYADSRDVKILAMKSLLIAGTLKEESLRAIERVVTHKNIHKDVIYLIFTKRRRIFGERPINLPIVGKQKYFDFLVEDISSGERATRGNVYSLFKIGKEIVNERAADYTEKIVSDMAKIYSGMPKEDQIKLAMSFIYTAKEEKVKRKYDHLIVDEILKVASGIERDEDFREVKFILLFGLNDVALEDGFSEESINNIKSMIFKSEDEEISSQLIKVLYRENDDDIQNKAYSLLRESDNIYVKVGVSRYFREKKDPSVISTYIEILKSLDAKKMMSEAEDGVPHWKRYLNIAIVMHINEFRGVTALDDDFETTRKDILEWWDKNSSDERFYFKGNPRAQGVSLK